MSLIIILLIGANIGWLASILFLVARARDVAANVAIGAVGALLFGGLASSISLLEGITPVTLLAAAVGSAVLLALGNIAFHRPSVLPSTHRHNR
jgi:uncharacterized membrane protein YeaQ/YmgE (transglycosylase-associated protein family)